MARLERLGHGQDLRRARRQVPRRDDGAAAAGRRARGDRADRLAACHEPRGRALRDAREEGGRDLLDRHDPGRAAGLLRGAGRGSGADEDRPGLDSHDRRVDRRVLHPRDLLVPLPRQSVLSPRRGGRRRRLRGLLDGGRLLGHHRPEPARQARADVHEDVVPAGSQLDRGRVGVSGAARLRRHARVAAHAQGRMDQPLAARVHRRHHRGPAHGGLHRRRLPEPGLLERHAARGADRGCGRRRRLGRELLGEPQERAAARRHPRVPDLLLLLGRAQGRRRQGGAGRHLVPDDHLRRRVRLHGDGPHRAAGGATRVPLRRLALDHRSHRPANSRRRRGDAARLIEAGPARDARGSVGLVATSPARRSEQ